MQISVPVSSLKF